MTIDNPPSADGKDSLYNDGNYLAHNPGWHQEDSARKVEELFSLLERRQQELNFPAAVLQISEVGCGYGGVIAGLMQVIENCQRVKCRGFGIDISQEAINNARQRHGDTVEFTVGDMTEVPPGNDLLVVVDLVEHLSEPEAFLRQAAQGSRYALFRFPLEEHLWNSLLGKKKVLIKELGHLHYYTYRQVLSLLRQNGFVIMDYAFTNNFSSPSNRKTLVAKIMAPLRGALSAVSQKMNSIVLGGNSLVVLARSRGEKDCG